MALIKCKECGGQVSTGAKACPTCGTRKFRKSRLPILFGALIAIGILANFADKSKTQPADQAAASSKEVKSSKAKKTSHSESSEECRAEIAKETYKVIKKIDKTHYWLVSESNTSGSGHMEMETQRSLPIGENVNFQEATFLGTKGDFSNLIVLWREGCSGKGKAAADYNQGTWWAQIDPTDPTGAPCVKAATAKYNIAPATLIKASNGGCVVSDGSSPFNLLFLDCTNSALGAKLVFTRTREQCLKYVAMAKAYSGQ